jgi:hypothetical protein
MHSNLTALLYKAEDHYLRSPEMIIFKHHVGSLGQRLQTYKYLRDREVEIFQSVVDRFSQNTISLEVNPRLLEKAVKDWLLVMRYGSMAMLLNNPEFFEHRLLEWLSDRVKAHSLQAIETELYQLLLAELKQLLSKEQYSAIEPFLIQAKTTLLETAVLSQVGG